MARGEYDIRVLYEQGIPRERGRWDNQRGNAGADERMGGATEV